MFPVTEEILKAEEKIKTEIDRNFYKVPKYDFKNSRTVMKNGNIEFIKDYRNIRNWFIKFLFTPIDAIPIYEGTGFGSSLIIEITAKLIDGVIWTDKIEAFKILSQIKF